ncbi:hypothetical protein ERO13_A10G155722v2 [Gossypium hirsutum]|uniref:Calcium-binding protein CML23 n=1 Tax=Gossypium hirsutum TaxID=3635 RepID=A0A1U8IEP9_GOSHI|nr:putative calcium-binding protein CML23 [Gossypium hirsutum]KAG4180268.1 hypothetical protein ERO13_A10G155722v2 [Gossypium hirsutum]
MMRSEEYKRILRCFDKDGDGKISAWELRHRLGRMGGELMLNEEEALGWNGDGLLDLEDVIELMEGGGEEEEKMKDLREAFEMYDGEGIGFITPQGLNKMLTKLGESKSIDECMVMIKHFDINGDGVITYDDFRVMMQ